LTTYDLNNRLVSFKDTEGYTFSFTYDPKGKGHTTGGTEGGAAPAIGAHQQVVHRDKEPVQKV
jgi:YD repeat-containing protein